MTIKQLKEKRAQVWAQMRDITAHAEGRDLNPDEIQRWDKLEGELTELTEQVRVAERQAELATEFDAPAAGPVDLQRVEPAGSGDTAEQRYEAAYTRYLRRGMGSLSAEDRQLMMSGLVPGDELRAQSAGVGTEGGYFVPAGFRAKIIERLKAWGNVRANAEVITTDTGNALPWPTNDDSGNVGAILAENAQITEQDVVLGQGSLGAYTYTSKLVRVSLQLLQDSAFDVEAFLARKFAERLGRATNAHFTTGTGTGQPQGVTIGFTTGVTGTTGQTTSVIFNNLVDLIHSVDPAYRSARSIWMAHDLTLAFIRKIRDDSGGAGLGRPIWEPSVQAGQPDTLLGYGVVVNNDMPVMAANAESIAFGDLEAGYIVREVLGIQSVRLEERYADFLQVGFFAFLRTDGKVQDANAVKLYSNSAT